MTKRPTSTAWYSPPQLLRTGVRVAISTVFGEFADRRIAIAAADPSGPEALDPVHDYHDRGAGDFWLDYLADTGDGWDATYAMARLVSARELRPDGAAQPLPRGSLLILGGDQVYPTASRDDYQARLRDPFDRAAAWADIGERGAGDLYAIPGNHDWYDGLEAFIGNFCRRRRAGGFAVARAGAAIGGRSTQQTRSYFAIRLPGGWWLWGADIQLTDFIDQPQVDYFAHVAANWMEKGSKLILCSGKPSWEYCEDGFVDPSFVGFSYLERIAETAGHQVSLVLSGDSHHYAHYVGDGRHYLTCGGGGAFLHPTHHLPDHIHVAQQAEQPARGFDLARDADGRPALYPDRATSRGLTWRNLGFAALNWQYSATLFVAYLLFDWLLDSRAAAAGMGSLAMALASIDTPGAALCTLSGLFFSSPALPILFAFSVVGYSYAADVRANVARWMVGGGHALAHLALVLLSAWLAARGAGDHGRWPVLLFAAVAAAAASATLFGIYLLAMLNLFGRHWNEAFSSLRIARYKAFLRLRIRPDGSLEVYPVGLTDVPSEPRSSEAAPLNPALEPYLIEQPIRIATLPRLP